MHARLEVLRDAARQGITDIDAGRFSTFPSAAQLASQLVDAAEEPIMTRARLRPR